MYNGSQLVQMTVGTDTLYFTYDANGVPATVTLNGTTYYYALNAQGDVIGIYTESGTDVCMYVYDAWGKLVYYYDNTSYTIDNLNPLRYRGYVFDQGTGLYYLQSRYYNPEWGRFINADAFVSTGQGILGNNMFAYCRNNPVRRIDISGTMDLDTTDGDDDGDLHEDIGFFPGGQSNSTTGSEGSTTIYRYGYAEAGAEKLVPTDTDVKWQHQSGLSFSTKPKPGSAMTTIDEVNSTGVLYAVVDGGYHVSVYPVGHTLAEWRAAGVDSIWIQALLGIVQISSTKEIVRL